MSADTVNLPLLASARPGCCALPENVAGAPCAVPFPLLGGEFCHALGWGLSEPGLQTL